MSRDESAPSDRTAAAIDPDLIWFFDSSKQLLVFRDTGNKGQAAAWSESLIVKSGWSVSGLRSLPRISVRA
jgi:hypothetical protein